MSHSALSGASGRKDYPSIDINILPDQYRPRHISWRAVRPWVMAAAFLLLLVPAASLYFQTSGLQEAAVQRVTDVRTALRAYTPLAEQKSALEAQIEQADQQSAEIEAAHASISIQANPWSRLLQEIIDTVPAGIVLTKFDQGANEVSIVGLAADPRLPLTLSETLMATGSFESATVNSIVRRTLAEPAEGESTSNLPPQAFEFEMTLSLQSEEIGQ
jgi:Tfp pilus assembly protein PilN